MASSSVMASSSAAAAGLHITIEKLSSLQTLQVTLHGASVGSGSVFASAPLCSLDSSFPSKPQLVLASGSAAAGQHTPLARIPLGVRVDLSDSRTRVSHTAGTTILSLRFKQDLAVDAGEDDFPTRRELDHAEYSTLRCRHCGTSVFAPRPVSSPFAVHSLPSPYWAELTDLWFCHTTNNAHVARIASTRIEVAAGKILVDKLLLRVHASDIFTHAQDQPWRRHESVQKVLAGLQAAAQAGCAMSDDPSSATSSASSAARDTWSPLPCANPTCHAVVGAVLLSLTPSLDPAEAVRPALNGEVRLFKYQLSNCARIKDAAIASPPAALVDSASPPACPCASLSSPWLVHTCGNLYASYSFENFVTEDLLQRFNKQPIGKFLFADDQADDAADEEQHAADQQTPRTFVRMFVTQWDLPLASSLVEAFPYTPSLAHPDSRLSSNALVSVLKVEFGVHGREDDPDLQAWIKGGAKRRPKPMHMHAHPPRACCGHYGPEACATPEAPSHSHGHAHSPTAASSSGSSSAAVLPPSAYPSTIDRVSYSHHDLLALVSLLQTRSCVWPEGDGGRIALSDATMQKSCLVKLAKIKHPLSSGATSSKRGRD